MDKLQRDRERGKTNLKKRKKKQRQGLKKGWEKKQTNKTEFGIEEKRASLCHDRDRNEGRRQEDPLRSSCKRAVIEKN